MKLLILIIVLILIYLIYQNTNNQTLNIATINIQKYQGLWYEIARLPVYFQQGCQSSTAYYKLLNDNTVDVTNRCIVNNQIIEVHGIAKPKYRVVNGYTLGTFEIKFDDSPFAGEYNVIYVDHGYRYAIVGSKNRKSLWILSRYSKINNQNLQQLLLIAQANGFNTNKLIISNQ